MNINLIKRYLGLFLVGVLPVLMYMMGLIFDYSMPLNLMVTFITIFLTIILYRLLTNTPLDLLVEGKGILIMDFNSTGMITPIVGLVANKRVYDTKGNYLGAFDRSKGMYLKNPVKTTMTVDEDNEENYIIKIPKNKKNDYTFKVFDYPTFIYNSHTKTFLDKKDLNKFELDSTNKSALLSLENKVDDLSKYILHFARSVIDEFQPSGFAMFIARNKALIIILLLLFLGLGAYYYMSNFNVLGLGSSLMPTTTAAPANSSLVGLR